MFARVTGLLFWWLCFCVCYQGNASLIKPVWKALSPDSIFWDSIRRIQCQSSFKHLKTLSSEFSQFGSFPWETTILFFLVLVVLGLCKRWVSILPLHYSPRLLGKVVVADVPFSSYYWSVQILQLLRVNCDRLVSRSCHLSSRLSTFLVHSCS